MDWANELWVKVYTRDTGDVLAVGWEGRYVLWELMRKVDRSGVLDETDDGVIAEMLRMPHEIAAKGLSKLAGRGVIERTDVGVVILNFLEAQDARASNKLRQAEFRARNRSKALKVTQAGQSVTKRNVTVTQNNAELQAVTNRIDKSRVDESRVAISLSGKPAGWASLTGAKKKVLGKWLDDAQRLWTLQDEKRSWKGCRALTPNAERLHRVAERLEAGVTVEECEQVLEYLGSQARSNAEQRQWFNGTTNWRPENFDRNAGRSAAASAGHRRAGDFGDDDDTSHLTMAEQFGVMS